MKYTEEHIRFLKINYPVMSQIEITNLFNKTFGCNVKTSAIATVLKRYGIKSGRTGHFEKGKPSWSAGKRGFKGANKTSFFSGHVPANVRPIGWERICPKDGFVLIKVNEPDPNTGFKTRFKHKHIHVWEQANGPVPEGMIVKFIDGNKQNCSIDNLVLVSRAELLRLNQRKYQEYPNEVKLSLLALTKLETRIFHKKKGCIING